MRRRLRLLVLLPLLPLGTALVAVIGSGTAWAHLHPYNNKNDTAACDSMLVTEAKFSGALQKSRATGTGTFTVVGTLFDCTDSALSGIQLEAKVIGIWTGVSNYAPTVATGGCDVAGTGTYSIDWSIQPVSRTAFQTLGYSELQYPTTTVTATGLFEATDAVSCATTSIPTATQQAFEVGSFPSCGPSPSDSAASGFQGSDSGANSQLEVVSVQDQTAVTTYGAGLSEKGLGLGQQTFYGTGDLYSS